jgi:hypothetical protein
MSATSQVLGRKDMRWILSQTQSDYKCKLGGFLWAMAEKVAFQRRLFPMTRNVVFATIPCQWWHEDVLHVSRTRVPSSPGGGFPPGGGLYLYL